MTYLVKENLNPSPIVQFAIWYEEAKIANEIEPSAMTVATVNVAYEISARTVLLKEFSEKGFVFFTNYNSPKGKALDEINKAALVFWWPKSQRQVRVTGKVEKVNKEASDRYFASRDRGSCISALASDQSQEIPSRAFLMEKYHKIEKQYLNQKTIPRPSFWGGYLVQPEALEFWQAGPHRLNDRFLYQKHENAWVISQLSP